jgi:pantoate--beta-alanine ligase
MEIFRSPAEMTAWSNETIRAGKTISLVPTMGCFHEGHLSLMRAARTFADHTVVSLFVNPAQFGPNEDYTSYPRVFEQDSRLAEQQDIDILFAPAVQDVYPDNFSTTIAVSRLTDMLCGASRPGHFAGVTTVVGKLFHIVKPQSALFGEKDFQQLAVIRRMVTDLNWDIKILSHPIVRERDGLAMSSRNVYLTIEERKSALALSKTISHIRQRVAAGDRDAKALIGEGCELFFSDPNIVLDYLQIVDEATLHPQEAVNKQSVLLIAAKIGKTRLIDNGRLM